MENFSGFFIKFVGVVTEDDDVIHVDNDTSGPCFADHVTENFIYEGLKCCWAIHHSKEHYHGFVETERNSEYSFPLISIFDANVVISCMDIKSCEVFSTFESIENGVNVGNGVGILDSVFIEIIILDWLKFAVFFLNKEEQCGLR